MNSDSTGGTDEETKLYPNLNFTINEDEVSQDKKIS